MLYSKLVDVYEELGRTSSRLEKIRIVADIMKESDKETLPMIVLLLQGKVFPTWSEAETGIAGKMVLKVLTAATGFPEKEVAGHFNETGDLGLTAEKLASARKQKTLGFKQIDVRKVFENLQKLASVGGRGSQDTKISIIRELLMHSSPAEAKYIVRTALGQLRVGVAEGVIRDAIVQAFFPEKEGDEKKEVTKAIEWAWFMRPDYAEVARIAKEQGLDGLRKSGLEPGKPIQVLLAEKAPSLKDALEAFENVQIEVKFDGARIQAQKDGDRVWLFTRRLENVTKQFPDIVTMIREGIKARQCVVEGEALAIGPDGKPRPFQILSQRIHRKYDIEKMVKEIPIQLNLFDIVYIDGKPLFDQPLRERRKLLESAVKVSPGKLQLAEPLVTKDLKKAERFYHEALRSGQEGVMVKNLDAVYQPGRRVAGGWLKVKPIMETLDLVITGAQWGTGKRAGWLGSFLLACRDSESGNFLECGMMGTGVKEKKTAEGDITFRELTEMLRPDIVSEKANLVSVKPKVVLEIAYEEIQKSPNYSSGYALRFPRLVRIRFDKSPENADTIERLSSMYEQQKGNRSK